jgi:hypothetical protein
MISNINYLPSKPASPLIGDAYLNNYDSTVNIFDGNRWNILQENNENTTNIKLLKELEDIKDYLKYKNVNTEDLEDFIISKQVLNKLAGE